MIKLNICDRIFEIEEKIIKKHSNSLLSVMIKNDKLFNNKNENGEYEFKDRDPNLFSIIYDYHINNDLNFEIYKIEELEKIKEEFLFWNMNESIIDQIDFVIFDKNMELGNYLIEVKDLINKKELKEYSFLKINNSQKYISIYNNLISKHNKEHSELFNKYSDELNIVRNKYKDVLNESDRKYYTYEKKIEKINKIIVNCEETIIYKNKYRVIQDPNHHNIENIDMIGCDIYCDLFVLHNDILNEENLKFIVIQLAYPKFKPTNPFTILFDVTDSYNNCKYDVYDSYVSFFCHDTDYEDSCCQELANDLISFVKKRYICNSNIEIDYSITKNIKIDKIFSEDLNKKGIKYDSYNIMDNDIVFIKY